jgi:hypothetical protein
MDRGMKKTIIGLSLMAMMFLLIGPGQSIGQTIKRIEFAKGKSSAVVTGTTGEYGVTYVIRARSGQKIVVDLKPVSNVGIKIEGNGSDGEQVLLREEKGGYYEVGLEESGDYTIFIGSLNHRSVSFTLTVKITKLADI